MHSVNEIVYKVNGMLDTFNKLSKKLAILLVVKLRSDDAANDYSEYSIITTYFSDKELNEIINGFQEFADFVDVSYGENQFIEKLQSGFYNHLGEYIKIAYSEQASGIRRSKSAIFPAICDLYGVKYCCNDIFTAALLDNKMATMNILKSFEFALPKTWFFRFDRGWLTSEPPKNLKLIAKPAYECASIGINNESVDLLGDNYFNHIKDLSRSLGQPVIVQEFICGYEVEVPVFDDFEAFTPCTVGISANEQQIMGDRFLSYDSIFDDEFKLFNFDMHDEQTSKSIKSEAKRLYQCLQLKGPVRIDFRITQEGEYYMMDYNNSPTLAKSHSFAFCMQELGFSYADMLKLIVYPALVL